jgi:hypothetical protein
MLANSEAFASRWRPWVEGLGLATLCLHEEDCLDDEAVPFLSNTGKKLIAAVRCFGNNCDTGRRSLFLPIAEKANAVSGTRLPDRSVARSPPIRRDAEDAARIEKRPR